MNIDGSVLTRIDISQITTTSANYTTAESNSTAVSKEHWGVDLALYKEGASPSIFVITKADKTAVVYDVD